MHRTLAILATAATLTTAATPPAAAGPINSLDECYNAVITWCNANFPEMDCSNASGLDDCDEEFGNQTSGLDRLHPQVPPRVMDRLIRVVRFQADQEDSRDDSRGGGTAGRP